MSSGTVWPLPATPPCKTGRPAVSVPVLSTTMVVTRSRACSACALRIRIPARAPRPIPSMTDSGVAKPTAQGQAMIRTATAMIRA